MTTPLQIIAMTGLAGTGKDTAAAMLTTHLGFTKVAFADAVRHEAAAAFNAPHELFTRRDLKEMQTTALALIECSDMGFIGALARAAIRSQEPANINRQWLEHPRSPRQIMQWWGTEYRRAQRVTWWLEKLREHITALHKLDGRTRFVVPDCRYENEAHLVRSMGGVIWQITRTGTADVELGHTSQTDGSKLDPSTVIPNNTTLHSLREYVLAHWLALETNTDVLNVELSTPTHTTKDVAA